MTDRVKKQMFDGSVRREARAFARRILAAGHTNVALPPVRMKHLRSMTLSQAKIIVDRFKPIMGQEGHVPGVKFSEWIETMFGKPAGDSQIFSEETSSSTPVIPSAAVPPASMSMSEAKPEGKLVATTTKLSAASFDETKAKLDATKLKFEKLQQSKDELTWKLEEVEFKITLKTTEIENAKQQRAQEYLQKLKALAL